MREKVIVINLTRFGDLLQTQPLIDDLHKSGRKTGLICLDNFASAASLLRHLSWIWPFNAAPLLANLETRWPVALQLMTNFANTVMADASGATIINLTPSLPARLLTRLLAAGDARVLGFGLDKLGYGENKGLWASFLAVSARDRHNSAFNVSDMFRRVGAMEASPMSGEARLAETDPQAAAWAENFLVLPEKAKGFIAFQTGASEDRRRWPLKNFLELGERIWKESRYAPVLLGSSSENALGEEYARQAKSPFLNAIGKTNLPQLAALLRRVSLLVTNDTGTMHLAAGLGVPIMAFFLASAQPWDTGPAEPGALCLEPAIDCHPCPYGTACGCDNACRPVISAKAAGDLAIAKLLHDDWKQGLTNAVLKECRPWVIERAKDGLLLANPLVPLSDDRSLWMRILRDFWRHILDEKPFEPQTHSSSSAMPLPTFAPEISKTLKQAFTILQSLQEFGRLMKKNSGAARLFLVNCERLQNLLDGAPSLASMAAFWREIRRNDGGDLDRFIPLTALLAEGFNNLAASLAADQ